MADWSATVIRTDLIGSNILTHAHKHKITHTRTRTHAHKHKITHTRTRTHAHKHKITHTRTRTHTLAHTHKNTQTLVLNEAWVVPGEGRWLHR